MKANESKVTVFHQNQIFKYHHSVKFPLLLFVNDFHQQSEWGTEKGDHFSTIVGIKACIFCQ